MHIVHKIHNHHLIIQLFSEKSSEIISREKKSFESGMAKVGILKLMTDRYRLRDAVAGVLRDGPLEEGVAVLADDGRPHVTGYIMPLDSVVVVIVQDGHAGFVVPFLVF